MCLIMIIGSIIVAPLFLAGYIWEQNKKKNAIKEMQHERSGLFITRYADNRGPSLELVPAGVIYTTAPDAQQLIANDKIISADIKDYVLEINYNTTSIETQNDTINVNGTWSAGSSNSIANTIISSLKFSYPAGYSSTAVKLLDAINKRIAENNTTDYTEQLRKLKTLLDDGILTEEEYQSKKEKILNS